MTGTNRTFELREHTADIAIEATGDSLGAVFGAVADGLAAAQCEGIPEDGYRFEIEERAETKEALLFDFLDRLIYERDVRSVLPAKHEAVVEPDDEEWTVTSSVRGVSLDQIAAREVKAVTYSEMRLEKLDDGWHAYVVLDV